MHFGIIMSLNLIIGAITPPFGVILFILKDIAGVTFGALVRAMLPFYIPLAITLLIVTYWPGLRAVRAIPFQGLTCASTNTTRDRGRGHPWTSA